MFHAPKRKRYPAGLGKHALEKKEEGT